MSTKVTYKGVDIINTNEPFDKELTTQGKYLEGNIRVQSDGGGSGASLIPITLRGNGNYNAPEGYGYSPVTVSSHLFSAGKNVDVDGKWHKPDDWDDIESMTFGANDSVLYYLIAPHAYKEAFFNFRCYGTTVKACVGRVSNGVFTMIGSETSITSGDYYQKTNLDTEFPNDNYIVVRITGNPITYVTVNTSSVNPKISATATPILMRYGNLPNSTSASPVATYYIQSDNIVNYWSNKTNQSLSLGSFYAGCYDLVRVRFAGWNIKNQKCSSLASFMSNCVAVSDVDTLDFTGWVKSTTTSLSSAFNGCQSLSGTMIVEDWDVSACTTLASCFGSMFNIDYIEGVETWTAAGKATTAASMFSACYNLKSIIDISSLNLGNGTAVLTTVATMFANCWAIKKIIFKNVNLESCTTVSGIFNYCKSLQEIEWDNVTPITDVCTTCTSMFAYCYSLTELPTDFAGWDFSKASVLSMFYYAWNLKRVEVSHTATPSTLTMADASSSKIFGYMCGLEYCDIEYLFTDYSQFSSTYAHSTYVESSWTKLKTFKTPGGLCKATTANSPVLSRELILEIFDRLVDRTGQSALKLTIGSVNLTKLSDADKAIATGKNWTLA